MERNDYARARVGPGHFGSRGNNGNPFPSFPRFPAPSRLSAPRLHAGRARTKRTERSLFLSRDIPSSFDSRNDPRAFLSISERIVEESVNEFRGFPRGTRRLLRNIQREENSAGYPMIDRVFQPASAVNSSSPRRDRHLTNGEF